VGCGGAATWTAGGGSRIMNANPSGYSGTPLPKKLGIKEGTRMLLIDAPNGYRALLKPLPKDAEFIAKVKPPHSFVHLFATSALELEDRLTEILSGLDPDGTIWVSWPKRSSGVKTDITEDTIREIALPMGLVDIKVCAIDATWSGLKLVIRKEKRKSS